jgi:hypothetical protein
MEPAWLTGDPAEAEEITRLAVEFDAAGDGRHRLIVYGQSGLPGRKKLRADVLRRCKDAIGALESVIEMLGAQPSEVADLADAKICARCHKRFRGLRSDSMYCSTNCRQAAYRQRNREQPYRGRQPQAGMRALQPAAQPQPRVPAVVRQWMDEPRARLYQDDR